MARRMSARSGSPFKTYVPPGDCVVVLRAIPRHLYATPHLYCKRPPQERERPRIASCLSAEVQAGAAEESSMDGRAPAGAGQCEPASRRDVRRKPVPLDEGWYREMAMDVLHERMAGSKLA